MISCNLNNLQQTNSLLSSTIGWSKWLKRSWCWVFKLQERRLNLIIWVMLLLPLLPLALENRDSIKCSFKNASLNWTRSAKRKKKFSKDKSIIKILSANWIKIISWWGVILDKFMKNYLRSRFLIKMIHKKHLNRSWTILLTLYKHITLY